MTSYCGRNRCRRQNLPTLFMLAATVLALLAASCAGPAASTYTPSGPPVARAEETETPTPEATAVDEPMQPPDIGVQEPSALSETPSLTPDTSQPTETATPVDTCPDQAPDPLPTHGAPGSQGFWQSFRQPLPPAPVWNPPGPKRVGIQAGHWLSDQAPKELSRLVGSGTSGGGYAEWQVTLDLAKRTAAILESYGVQVDVLPATVPPSYRAHAFVAIHADGDTSGTLRGFKVARAGFSAIPEADDALVNALNTEYAETTGMNRDDVHISRQMQYYYAFNSRRYCHAIAPGVPAAIIETGYLTNASDRAMLLGSPDTIALGIARGILDYLGMLDNQG